LKRDEYWCCDGCGAESNIRKIDEWRWVKISITSAKDSTLLDGNFELCPACQMQLLNNADTRRWSRRYRVG
jgi:hypothetical protein